MAVTVTVGTNSWVTIAEADTYLEDRFGASAWAALTDTIKGQLLITAFRWIQSLSIVDISAAATAQKVKDAQMELAWYVYNYFTQHEKRRALYAQGVRDFKISKWEEELDKSSIPDYILDYLEDYLTNLGGTFPVVSRDFD